MTQLQEAAIKWFRRNDKFMRWGGPNGKFGYTGKEKFTSWKFQLAPEELRKCCKIIQGRPLDVALKSHCKSYKHIANLCGVDRQKLIREVKKVKSMCFYCVNKLEKIVDGKARCVPCRFKEFGDG